ncbi:hypothetical protein EF847_06025 [Actinobacteria bacterium YIM 96077]|uniref:DUF732 domain-containing protein n=1 Tax=Phytoactinopolyspora halophila TaxID=1981511 RepID=A0A329QN31_9ACTN|nr:hypothetical protein [Phytoactinopolyspora halophila]AYY12332.1 hypothetical protein EF847_06025 [Actinobacteria bacterium YIM 96077]RAW13750.1 hypothetical protein DPM12_12130 [Phytoactinopolyspora halophila]
MTRSRRTLSASVTAIAVALAACTTDEPEADGDSTRTRAPAEDFAENMKRCMGDKGWELTIDDDGSVMGSAPVEQRDQYRNDMEACKAEYGYDLPPPPMTREQAEEHYAELADAAQCIKDLGYAVPEPPSKQASIESLMSESRDPLWFPYKHVVDTKDRSEIERVFAECPQPE